MKKFIYLMAMVCTLGAFTSCNDDNDEPKAKRLEAIEGTWNVEESKMDPTTYEMTGSIKINWEGDEEKGVFKNFMGSGEDYPVSSALAMVSMLGNAKLPTVLKSVTFTKDGKIIALYKETESTSSTESDGWKTAEDYASYAVVNDNLINVSLNISKVTEGIEDQQEKAMIEGMLKQYPNIPVHISWDATKTKPFFYVDKEFVQPIIMQLLGTLDKIPTADMDEEEKTQFENIKGIATQLPGILNATTKLEAGIELTK